MSQGIIYNHFHLVSDKKGLMNNIYLLYSKRVSESFKIFICKLARLNCLIPTRISRKEFTDDRNT